MSQNDLVLSHSALSSSANVRSFRRPGVVLHLDFDAKRRSCAKWDKETSSFRLRRRPHPLKWRKAFYEQPKVWFRKEAVRGVGGGWEWKLTPLLTDGVRACCLVCVKKSEMDYHRLSGDGDRSWEKVGRFWVVPLTCYSISYSSFIFFFPSLFPSSFSSLPSSSSSSFSSS